MLQQPKENQMKLYAKIFDYMPRNTKTVIATILLTTLSIHDKQDNTKTKQDSKAKSSVSAFNTVLGYTLPSTYVVKDLRNELSKTKNDESVTLDSLNKFLVANPVKTTEPNTEKTVEKADSEVKIVTGKKSVKYIYKDGTVEIREGGTLAWRNKNPGALRSGNNAVGMANKFAVFASEEEGMTAMKTLLRSDKYCNLSLKAAIFKYAPPHENNTTKYQSDLKRCTGLDITRKLRDLNEEELERVAQTIKKLEGWKPGKLTRTEPQKQMIDTLIQQNVR